MVFSFEVSIFIIEGENVIYRISPIVQKQYAFYYGGSCNYIT